MITTIDLSTRLLKRLFGDAIPIDRLDEAMRVREAALAIALEDAVTISPAPSPIASPSLVAKADTDRPAPAAEHGGTGGSSSSSAGEPWNPCGHPVSEITQGREGTSYCRLSHLAAAPAAAGASPSTSPSVPTLATSDGEAPPPAAVKAVKAKPAAAATPAPGLCKCGKWKHSGPCVEPSDGRRTCSRPGCKRALRSDNTTGVCAAKKKCDGIEHRVGTRAPKTAPDPASQEEERGAASPSSRAPAARRSTG